MKRLFVLIAAAGALTLGAQAQSPQIYAGDTGKYLGNLNANEYDPNSVSNPYGRYGSPYSADSVNNPYGKYGSPYSPYSANNPYAVSRPAARPYVSMPSYASYPEPLPIALWSQPVRTRSIWPWVR